MADVCGGIRTQVRGGWQDSWRGGGCGPVGGEAGACVACVGLAARRPHLEMQQSEVRLLFRGTGVMGEGLQRGHRAVLCASERRLQLRGGLLQRRRRGVRQRCHGRVQLQVAVVQRLLGGGQLL